MKINCDREMLTKRPGAVLFDLDNTLYDYEHSHAKALSEVRAKLGRNAGIAPERFDALYDEARKSIKADLKNNASAHSRLLYFQRMIEMTGLRSDVVMALDCEQTYWRTFLSAASLFPDVEETMRLIRSLGIQMAIVTDLTAQIQFRKIVYFGLESIVDHVVTSEEAGADKPASPIFEIVKRKLDLKPGAPLWMIGDDAKKDCEGAKTHLGAVTFLRRSGAFSAAPGEADVVFDRFDEIKTLIQRIAER
ncbi:MAG: HAD family hydrolase [Pseudomonadota bacterium]